MSPTGMAARATRSGRAVSEATYMPRKAGGSPCGTHVSSKGTKGAARRPASSARSAAARRPGRPRRPRPDDRRRGEGDDGGDPGVVGGEQQRSLRTEGRADDGEPVALAGEGVEALGERLQRDLVRRRLLSLAAEPADRHGERAVLGEQPGALVVDPSARPGENEHASAAGLVGSQQHPLRVVQPVLDHARQPVTGGRTCCSGRWPSGRRRPRCSAPSSGRSR